MSDHSNYTRHDANSTSSHDYRVKPHIKAARYPVSEHDERRGSFPDGRDPQLTDRSMVRIHQMTLVFN